MSSDLFKEWDREIDQTFGTQKRKIALIIDNCPAHHQVRKLDWVVLIFLPPNTTSMTQPIDRGIIRSTKAKFRSFAVKKYLVALENGVTTPNISVLSAMVMLRKA